MKTFQLPRIACEVKLNLNPTCVPLFSLFEKIDGKWVRIRTTAFPWNFAAKVFRNAVLDNPYRREVRVVENISLKCSLKTQRFSGPRSPLAGIRREKIRQGVNDLRTRGCD